MEYILYGRHCAKNSISSFHPVKWECYYIHLMVKEPEVLKVRWCSCGFIAPGRWLLALSLHSLVLKQRA